MNDLISRSEAIRLLRLHGNPYNNFVEQTIKSIPSYDLVKVIRCIEDKRGDILDIDTIIEIIKSGGITN